MHLSKSIKAWLIAPFALIATLIVLAALYIAIFGWNWARAPIQKAVQSSTGRALVIHGDLTVKLGWPLTQVRAQAVTFANPSWATNDQMAVLAAATLDVDVWELLHQKLVFPKVHLNQPLINLERAPDGRKTWLLDRNQSDENARGYIGVITLDQGQLTILENSVKTKLQVAFSTLDASDNNVAFKATGSLKGLSVVASGEGGSVLAIRDESKPFPISVKAVIGRTNIQAKGQITSLVKFSAVDLQLNLRGDSLAELFPIVGVGFPATLAYATSGRLIRDQKTWRYEKFSGKVGRSDIGGSLQVELGAARPMLRGNIVSQALAFEDLGPPIGVRKKVTDSGLTAKPARVLPDIPFNPDSWQKFDADVTLKATKILRNEALPLDQLVTRIHMQNAVLTLSPLDFSAAGGQLKAAVKLDGQQGEIKGSAQVKVEHLLLSKLFPSVALAQSSIGQLNGQIDFAGTGNTVAKMLSTADGNLRLVVGKGEISKLMMEQMGLHLLEVVQLTLSGDKNISLNCVVADFGIKRGIMTSRALILDTDITTVVGNGQIDLGKEELNLNLVPRTRKTSLISLRSPITVKGTLAAPVASINKTSLIARGAGAIALGLVNPLLAFLPLVEAGPGLASECGR